MSNGEPLASGDGRRYLPLSGCRKVFLQRDYSRGLAIRFCTTLPQDLENFIDAVTLEKTVSELNRRYEAAEKIGPVSACETLLGCITCYLSQLCITTQFQKQLGRIAKYLREQNEMVYMPRGLFITDPMERGLRVIEISILIEEPAAPANNVNNIEHV